LKIAVKRVSLLASEDTFKIKFDIADGQLVISSAKREEGEAVEKIEDCSYNGENLTIAFNYRYLISIINVIESENIEIKMGKSNEPALFFNTDINDSYSARFLLMPLRLV